jgi:aryl-alcohol dehydrogenase-like predicted oxidoreductase
VLDVEGPTSTNILATCRELGVTLIAYSPLGRGLLTSTFANNEYEPDSKDFRQAYFPRFSKDNRENNVKFVKDFKALAEKKGCSTSQLSLAWLLKQGGDMIPIPGTRKIEYLEDNWGALSVNLTDKEETEIRMFVENADIAGGALPAGYGNAKIVDTAEEA